MKFERIFLAWYDFWIGVYVDRAKRRVYICPLPCVVIQLSYLKPGWLVEDEPAPVINEWYTPDMLSHRLERGRSFYESYAGKWTPPEPYDVCPTCKGERCSRCKGTGYVQHKPDWIR